MNHNKGQVLPILVFLICVSLGIGSIWVSLNFKPGEKEAETYVSYSDTGKFVNVSGCPLGDLNLAQAESCHDGLNGTEYCDLGNLACTIPSQNTTWSAYKFICDEMNSSGECGNVPNGGQDPIDSDKTLSGRMEITQEDIEVCGRWIQIDIFDKDCNPNNDGDWQCSTPLDFFNYYTGDCACNDIELTVTNIDESESLGIGDTVRFELIGSASTYTRDTITGLGETIICPLKTDGTIDIDWNDNPATGGKIDCVVNQAGEYSWTHYWQNCEENANNCSDECSKSANFTVTEEVSEITCQSKKAYKDDPTNSAGKYVIGPDATEITEVNPGDIFVYYIKSTESSAEMSADKVSWLDILDNRLELVDKDFDVSYDPNSRIITCNDVRGSLGSQLSMCAYRVRVKDNASLGDLTNTATFSYDGGTESTCSTTLQIVREDEPLTCSSLSTSSTSFKRGETMTLTCSGTGTNASYANFRVEGLDWILNKVSLSAEGTASASLTIPNDEENLGPYIAQCQICSASKSSDTQDICTIWGEANVQN